MSELCHTSDLPAVCHSFVHRGDDKFQIGYPAFISISSPVGKTYTLSTGRSKNRASIHEMGRRFMWDCTAHGRAARNAFVQMYVLPCSCASAALLSRSWHCCRLDQIFLAVVLAVLCPAAIWEALWTFVPFQGADLSPTFSSGKLLYCHIRQNF
jgi:hypothetical protein